MHSTAEGTSINAFPSSHEELTLLYGTQVTSRCSETEARNCLQWCLNNSLVEQKVVMCDKNSNVDSVKAAEALGCMVPNYGNNFNSEAISNPDAPLVASFSSRGPSRFISYIIKPDATASGVEILAAYSPMASPSETYISKRSVNYTVLSGHPWLAHTMLLLLSSLFTQIGLLQQLNQRS
ncbi:hypothetical protein L1887_33235 [Cichorium endivia]|nr:hypothetical protein L1887_33235 [Cichorium endivia]